MDTDLDKLKTELTQTMMRFKSLHGFFHSAEGFNLSDAIILRVVERKNELGDVSDKTALIQHHLHISKPAVSQKLTQLEERGLITREINKTDRRRFNFTLTETGTQLAAQAQQHADERISGILKCMGEQDLRELIRLCSKLADIIEENSQEEKVGTR